MNLFSWRFIIILPISIFLGYILYKKYKAYNKSKINLDQKMLQKIKRILISNDVGLMVTNNIIKTLESKYGNKTNIHLNDMKKNISDDMSRLLKPHMSSLNHIGVKTPEVFVLMGNNGVGKTNLSIKLSYFLQKNRERKILITSLDFFRAGAWEQLKLLVEKNATLNIDYLAPKAKNVKGHTYDSYVYAQQNNYDALILDTSGRIHTHEGLMDEVTHINNILASMNSQCINILVLDNNFGAMAINSYEAFLKVTKISGIVITKTDSKCGGGWLIRLVEQHPEVKIFGQVKGENVESFDNFDPLYFSEKIVNWSDLND